MTVTGSGVRVGGRRPVKPSRCRWVTRGQPLLNAGTFKVDAPTLRGPPDTIGITALAAEQSSGLRTVQNRAFEELTLKELVLRIAAELELTVVGDVPDLVLGRVTQTETNLAFSAPIG